MVKGSGMLRGSGADIPKRLMLGEHDASESDLPFG
jgi:hypothetical protein